MMFKFFVEDNHTVEFYLLGDKAIENYEDHRINRTLWAHGEYQATEKLQLDYDLGEDQKRDKAGVQVSYRFNEAIMFVQGLYQSSYVDGDPSNNLLDVMAGYDEQLTNKWHVRIESGYQKINRYANNSSFGERFLPTEYFVALANQYEIHPLVKLSATVINDIKTRFAYVIARSTFDLGHNMEADIFGFTPVAKGNDPANLSQKLVTSDIGFSLRAFF